MSEIILTNYSFLTQYRKRQRKLQRQINPSRTVICAATGCIIDSQLISKTRKFECSLVNMLYFCSITTICVCRTLDYDAVECISPNRKRMMDVPVQHFACTPPQRPIIKWEPLNDVEYRVRCSRYNHS